MAHNPQAPQGEEVRKTRWRAMPYASGKGLDLGCGMEKLLDTTNCIGIDSDKDNALFGRPAKFDIKADVSELRAFASGVQDYVFSSHVLEHFPYEQVTAILREWMRVLRVGGRLILYLPDMAQYPLCKEPALGISDFQPWCNQDHKWNVNYDRVVAAMEKTGYNWDLVHYEQCSQDEEYSLFFVFKKLK